MKKIPEHIWSGNEKLFLVLILLFAFLARFSGIDYFANYFYNADEYVSVIGGLNVADGNLWPIFYKYGPITQYFYGLIYYLYFFLLSLGQHFSAGIHAILNGFPLNGNGMILLLLGRYVSLIFGIGTLAVFYLVSRDILGIKDALLGTLLLSLCPLQITFSQFMKVDMIFFFWVLATLWLALKLLEKDETRIYIWAGVLCGLAMAVRYNFIVVYPVLAAYLIKKLRSAGLKDIFADANLYLFLLVCTVTFLLLCPFVFLDFARFHAHLSFAVIDVRQPITSLSLRQYFSKAVFENLFFLALNIGPFLLIFGFLGWIKLFKDNLDKAIVLLSFPLIYMAFISVLLFKTHSQIYFPLSAYFIIGAVCFFRSLRNQKSRLLRIFAPFGLILIAANFLLIIFLNPFKDLDAAGRWIDENIKRKSEAISALGMYPSLIYFNWYDFDKITLKNLDYLDPLAWIKISDPEFLILRPVNKMVYRKSRKVRFLDDYEKLLSSLEAGDYAGYRKVKEFSPPGILFKFKMGRLLFDDQRIIICRRINKTDISSKIELVRELVRNNQAEQLTNLIGPVGKLPPEERDQLLKVIARAGDAGVKEMASEIQSEGPVQNGNDQAIKRKVYFAEGKEEILNMEENALLLIKR